MIKAKGNGRDIPVEDKIFALNGRAKKKIREEGEDAVINATIGALLDDEGELCVINAVSDQIKKLKPIDFAEYAPIGGTFGFKLAMIDACFGLHKTNRHVRVVATPGGTGAIHCAVSNYSSPGQAVLTSDWYWSPYMKICNEMARSLETFELFDDSGIFNFVSFEQKLQRLLSEQGSVLILLNTPAHNPTGYSLDDDEWAKLVRILNRASKKGEINLFIDAAYIDFSGEADDARIFLPELEKCEENVFPMIGYSASKTFTMYGMRCGAILCLSREEEEAKEFQRVCEYTARATWSNCNRAAQTVIEQIYSEEDILADVDCERETFRAMLERRGRAFERTLRGRGIEPVPFDAGFFACVAVPNAEEISERLEEKGIFVVPLQKGLRISLASISEDDCIKVAEAIADVMTSEEG